MWLAVGTDRAISQLPKMVGIGEDIGCFVSERLGGPDKASNMPPKRFPGSKIPGHQMTWV